MAPAPFLVPCLTVLRAEFNAVAPRRDKGADGWIGDPAHAARKSDHNPDDRGRVLALDIDSSGPWPGGAAWFNTAVLDIVARHRAGKDARLEYVIWNRKIASRTIDNWRWRDYTASSDDHTNHAHFSGRHDHVNDHDTSPWGVLQEDNDMALTDDMISITEDTAKEIGARPGDKKSAATLVQLAVIFAARADDTAAANKAAIDGARKDIAALRDQLTQLPAGGQPIDYDVLADKILDRYIARMQN